MIQQFPSWAYLDKTIIQKDACTPMLAALIAKTLKQPKRPLTEEWIKNTPYIQ